MSDGRSQEIVSGDHLVLTGAGDLVRAGMFERGQQIAAHLRAEAERLDDSFGDIAALLFELATWQALQLEGVHALARSLDAHAGGATNVMRSVADRVADARRLFAAFHIFKALAEHEHDVRMLFDLAEQAPSNANAVEATVKAS